MSNEPHTRSLISEFAFGVALGAGLDLIEKEQYFTLTNTLADATGTTLGWVLGGSFANYMLGKDQPSLERKVSSGAVFFAGSCLGQIAYHSFLK